MVGPPASPYQPTTPARRHVWQGLNTPAIMFACWKPAGFDDFSCYVTASLAAFQVVNSGIHDRPVSQIYDSSEKGWRDKQPFSLTLTHITLPTITPSAPGVLFATPGVVAFRSARRDRGFSWR